MTLKGHMLFIIFNAITYFFDGFLQTCKITYSHQDPFSWVYKALHDFPTLHDVDHFDDKPVVKYLQCIVDLVPIIFKGTLKYQGCTWFGKINKVCGSYESFFFEGKSHEKLMEENGWSSMISFKRIPCTTIIGLRKQNPIFLCKYQI